MRSKMILAVLALVLACRGSDGERASPLATLAKDCRDAEMSCPRPIFGVTSLRASQIYYREALGFKLDWDHGEPPDFGAVSRSETQLFLGQTAERIHGSWVMVFTKDVDALHAEYVRRKAIIKQRPTNMPWGVREMHVADLDGNTIRFGGPTR